MIIPQSLGTHDGTFHADEVTACALLVHYGFVDEGRIVRTRCAERLAECEFVCDVGGEYEPSRKRFDHHQVSYKGDFSSAGMVWSYLKEIGTVDSTVYSFLNRTLIQGVDAHDNGKELSGPGVCTFSQVISNFVPVHYDAPPKEQDLAFGRALEFVLGHIRRSLERFAYIRQCRDAVKAAMETEGPCLYFEEAMPWIDAFFDLGGESHPALFVMMPSGGHWKVRGIPPTSDDRMKVRKPLPGEWAGLLDAELKRVSGIPGAVFCHKGRFISVWETKEDAVRALQKILK